MLLLDPPDRMHTSQPLCRLTTPLRVVVVIVLEVPDLVLELATYFDGRSVSVDFCGKRDVPDMGEGVVYSSRLGVISAQVL